MTTPDGTPSQQLSGGSAGNAVEDARRQAAAGEGNVVSTNQDMGLDAGDVAAQSRWASVADVNEAASSPQFTRD